MPITTTRGLLPLLLFAWMTATPAQTNEHLAALAQSEVLAFSGNEAISSLYRFDVEVAAPSPAINFSQVLDQPLTLTVAPGRQVSGIVQRIDLLDTSPRSGRYRITLTSPMARLDYRLTSRSFQEVTVPELAASLLSQVGISSYELRLDGTYPTEALLVQYQESELAFLSRRLERLGIYYHFESAAAGETLVVGDGTAPFPNLPDPRLRFSPRGAPSVTTFSRGQSLHSGQIRSGNYAWQTPGADLSASAQTGAFPGLVEALFPAPVRNAAESQRFAGVRAAARIASAQACSGTSSLVQMRPGHRFTLTGHPRRDFNQEYLIVSVEHNGASDRYENRFTCLPASMPFRPLPVTPEPRISGLVPAIVLAPSGESRHVDQFGRVQVRFPWSDPAFSTSQEPGDAGWVRVAQLAAGSHTAALWLPEAGEEVAVAFEQGDPDRPIVVGSLYNGQQPPPVALPQNRHLTVMRSGTAVPIEIVLAGQPGSEQLILRVGQQSIVLDPEAIRATAPISVPRLAPQQQRARPQSAPLPRQRP